MLGETWNIQKKHFIKFCGLEYISIILIQLSMIAAVALCELMK